MSSRANLYQSKLNGYLLCRVKDARANTSMSRYLPFEGLSWWPIDVDQGSKDSPIDVEWWTYLRDHPGDWSSTAPTVITTVDPKVFDCCVCWDTLHKPVMPLCMHVFCYACIHKWLKAGRTSCPVCRAPVGEAPIRDNAFEMELVHAVANGVVKAPVATPVVTYDWANVVFAEVVALY
ncbi:hypothetical protein C8R44DRAFT_878203 [Mycena epipterygia]|nr:hypothetical protein C8R44DRAFT_878203 [Mycena epipterygia]